MNGNAVKDCITTIPKIGMKENISTDLKNKDSGLNLKRLRSPRKKKEKKKEVKTD